jgi:signal transduction histidine kinase
MFSFSRKNESEKTPEEALHKSIKKSPEINPEGKESGGDSATQESEVALIKHTLDNFNSTIYIQKLDENFKALRDSLTNLLDNHEKVSEKVDHFQNILKTNIDQINDMYNDLLNAYTSPEGKGENRTKYHKELGEMITLVRDRYKLLTKELEEKERELKLLEINKGITEVNAEIAYKSFEKMRQVLNPGKDIWKN